MSNRVISSDLEWSLKYFQILELLNVFEMDVFKQFKHDRQADLFNYSPTHNKKLCWWFVTSCWCNEFEWSHLSAV